MGPSQKEALGKLSRQTWVIGIYRWVIEVTFLFAAFTEFPEHKWSIGLAVLVFSGGIGGLVHYMQLVHAAENVAMDEAERKTRHAIVRAAELAAAGEGRIEQWEFWSEVDRRVAAEREPMDGGPDKPTGFWKGLLLAAGSLLWQLVASLFGIALVASLTS
ncbi:MAG: hypothetical protein ACK4NE_09760 [Albidovulum sp.]